MFQDLPEARSIETDESFNDKINHLKNIKAQTSEGKSNIKSDKSVQSIKSDKSVQRIKSDKSVQSIKSDKSVQSKTVNFPSDDQKGNLKSEPWVLLMSKLSTHFQNKRLLAKSKMAVFKTKVKPTKTKAKTK